MKDSKKQTGIPSKGNSDKKSQKSTYDSQQKAATSSTGNGKAPQMWDDDRFAHLINNPRYHGIPKSKKKVKIDSRFKAMFEDERFNQKATMDKYGRKIKKTDSDMLRKFYHLDSDEEENEQDAEREREREERAMEGRAGSDSEPDADEGLELTEEERKAGLSSNVKKRLNDMDVDFARGEGVLGSESSSDGDSDGSEDEEEDVFIEHVWGALDADAERTEESTRRLAVCNMDWDRVRAVDVMVLLSSFLPPGSAIKSVTIYPSEFGKQRMKEEEERGPQELTARTIENSAEEDEEDEEVQKERLREYQLNRLKYYYAVAECDSVATADKIYTECDGIEYESTANKLDLRFIPDDMEFDDEPKDHCTELPEVGKYVPRIFATKALHQAKVELTWDENDPDRKEFNEKLRDGKWANLPEHELKKYVVCSSSDEEEDDDDGETANGKSKRPTVRLRAPGSDSEEDDEADGSDTEDKPKGSRKEKMIAKYRALLNDIKEQEQAEQNDKVGMEFTWEVNGKDEKPSNDQSDEESDDNRAGGAKKTQNDDVNPFEKILLKKKEKSKRRKELKKRRKRGELDGAETKEDDTSEDDLPYGVDLNDPFFASAFDEKEFAVGEKKKSKQKDREAAKQAQEEEEREAEESERRRAELELMLDDGEDNRAHFNLRAIQEREIDLATVSKSKRRHLLKKSRRQIEEQRNSKQAADDFEVNVEDPRFTAIYSKPDYNIDPTNPAFKKTKAMERLIETKLRKRQLAENDTREGNGGAMEQQEAKVARKDVATTMLVKSIKRKIKNNAS
ncbi:ESF1 homolog [Anopheles maculipalpis]|uniref:ESF1 homolog n=1 Tax=Anopheles maculipalpis TaxID=1496333 RepID=UPI0021590DA6|nr:ESF1 homolog [Anopheles maculipalpis]